MRPVGAAGRLTEEGFVPELRLVGVARQQAAGRGEDGRGQRRGEVLERLHGRRGHGGRGGRLALAQNPSDPVPA